MMPGRRPSATAPIRPREGADAAVLVTEWDVLRALDLTRLAAAMAQPVFVDLRNVYPPEDVIEAGLALARCRKARHCG